MSTNTDTDTDTSAERTVSKNNSGLDPNVRETPAVQATGPHTSTLLATDGLVKQFGGFTAIDEVDLSIGAGELRCLIGPNGAGKSTLLKLITGRHDASAGNIYYRGHDVTDMAPFDRVDRGIGMKFQVPSVFTELTAAENVRLPLQRIDREASLGESIHTALERVGLADRAGVQAGELSHGEQQRLEIGMAAALEPELLMLDEPVAGLSIEERADVAELVTELNEDGIAFVVIEHDIDFVARIADAVTVLHQGAIFREGAIEEIRDDDEVRRIYLGGA